ncbi:allantoate amidohydrolase domain protein [Escherichia coli E128010]|nr:allantoate amidohydrolase domain protein [Escherichia coli E128010]
MITHFRQAIEETLPWLSSFGADPTGGMTRLLYSPEWLETQQQLKKEWQQVGWKHVSMK